MEIEPSKLLSLMRCSKCDLPADLCKACVAKIQEKFDRYEKALKIIVKVAALHGEHQIQHEANFALGRTPESKDA